jgi:phosphinothricin acetyltransferase
MMRRMTIRTATADDAEAVAAIYTPIVRDTVISFELEPPSVQEMRSRIVSTLQRLPWLVSLDARGDVNGYVYASKHRERAAYQWAVDVTAYVRADSRGQGVGKRLYTELLRIVRELGYYQAFAGIALPNEGSVALHESVGFERIAVYRNVGFKLGAWRDVGVWQNTLQALPDAPAAPRAFAGGVVSTSV